MTAYSAASLLENFDSERWEEFARESLSEHLLGGGEGGTPAEW